MGFKAPRKKKKLLPVLELALEMNLRGFKFYPVGLYSSEAHRFMVYKDGLLFPFSALPNVGATVAQSIVEARAGGVLYQLKIFSSAPA